MAVGAAHDYLLRIAFAQVCWWVKEGCKAVTEQNGGALVRVRMQWIRKANVRHWHSSNMIDVCIISILCIS
jgi:hypothetical protein